MINILGETVNNIFSGFLEADVHSFKWDGKDKNGRLVDNGTYFIRLEYDEKIKWIKLVVIK